MKFKIDENLPTELAEYLKSQGNDTHTVYDEGIVGAKDEVIGKKYKEEERILITLDQDFSDIRAYPPELYSGIIVLRLKRQDKFHVLKTFQRIYLAFELEEIKAKLWVIDENRIRIRE